MVLVQKSGENTETLEANNCLQFAGKGDLLGKLTRSTRSKPGLQYRPRRVHYFNFHP